MAYNVVFETFTNAEIDTLETLAQVPATRFSHANQGKMLPALLHILGKRTGHAVRFATAYAMSVAEAADLAQQLMAQLPPHMVTTDDDDTADDTDGAPEAADLADDDTDDTDDTDGAEVGPT